MPSICCAPSCGTRGESVSGYHAKLQAGTKLAVTPRRCGREHRVEIIRGQLTDLLIKQNVSRLVRLAQNPELQDLHPVQVTLVGAEDETPEDIRDALQAQPD
jgi:hypothetical protein